MKKNADTSSAKDQRTEKSNNFSLDARNTTPSDKLDPGQILAGLLKDDNLRSHFKDGKLPKATSELLAKLYKNGPRYPEIPLD